MWGSFTTDHSSVEYTSYFHKTLLGYCYSLGSEQYYQVRDKDRKFVDQNCEFWQEKGTQEGTCTY